MQYNVSGDNLTSFTTVLQQATLIDLNEYTVYAVSVSAYTRVGLGPYIVFHVRTGQASECVSVYFIIVFTMCASYTSEPHSPPTSIVVPQTEEQAATITWQPPVLDDRNGVITFYLLIIRNLQFSLDDINVNVSGSDLSYTVEGLEEYCRYDCQIAAGTIIGSGPFSSHVQFLTMEDGKCSTSI